MLEVGWLNISFIILTLIELFYFWWASGKNKLILYVCGAWLVIQALIANTGFYQKVDVLPPRLLIFVFIPVTIALIYFGLSRRAQKFRSEFNIERLHYIHFVRVIVELVFLYTLFELGFVAQVLTFEGNNFDIIPGLTMPIAAFLFWRYKSISRQLLIAWNVVCFGVLIFTISQAILSAPFPYQRLSFEQPTTAVLYFPFVWLPAFVAPLVLLSHLISIKRLIVLKN